MFGKSLHNFSLFNDGDYSQFIRKMTFICFEFSPCWLKYIQSSKLILHQSIIVASSDDKHVTTTKIFTAYVNISNPPIIIIIVRNKDILSVAIVIAGPLQNLLNFVTLTMRLEVGVVLVFSLQEMHHTKIFPTLI